MNLIKIILTILLLTIIGYFGYLSGVTILDVRPESPIAAWIVIVFAGVIINIVACVILIACYYTIKAIVKFIYETVSGFVESIFKRE